MEVASQNDKYSLENIQNFKGQYPPQLWWLFLSEMWERFSFYGMRGMLTIFMMENLMLKPDEAQLQYGATQAFVYTLAFVGGLFADKILGFRKSIFWGGLLMIAGSFLLSQMPAKDPKEMFYLGISFIIVGTGFFKPNISTMVGSLYKQGDNRRDAGFGLFYSGINIGAFLGGYYCIHVANHQSWNAAFALAGYAMIAGLTIFFFTKRTLGTIGLPPELPNIPKQRRLFYDILVYAGSLVVIPLILILVSNSKYTDYFMYTVGPLTFIYILYETFKLPQIEKEKMGAALLFIIFSIFFWAFFEQAGGSLSIFARYLVNGETIMGLTIDPNEVNNSSNSLFVILLSPLVGMLWYWTSKRKIEPNTVIKFGIGFLFVSLSFYVYYLLRYTVNTGGKTSLWIFAFGYFVATIGELCLSPIGLSIMTTLAPKKLHGVMMGIWFLASAYGQYAAGLLGAGMVPADTATNIEKINAYTQGYLNLALYGLISGIALFLLTPLIKKWMHDVH